MRQKQTQSCRGRAFQAVRGKQERWLLGVSSRVLGKNWGRRGVSGQRLVKEATPVETKLGRCKSNEDQTLSRAVSLMFATKYRWRTPASALRTLWVRRSEAQDQLGRRVRPCPKQNERRNSVKSKRRKTNTNNQNKNKTLDKPHADTSFPRPKLLPEAGTTEPRQDRK